MTELTLAQRLRVFAETNPNGFTMRLDRASAMPVIHQLEKGEAIIDIEARLAAMRFDVAAHQDRAERSFANIVFSLCACASALCTLAFIWRIA